MCTAGLTAREVVDTISAENRSDGNRTPGQFFFRGTDLGYLVAGLRCLAAKQATFRRAVSPTLATIHAFSAIQALREISHDQSFTFD